MADRRLVLVRHAQAGEAPFDSDRELTEHGRHQAEAVGEWLARGGLVADAVLVSPARRTLQTWDRIGAALGAVPERVVDERLYDNTVDSVLDAIREIAAEAQSLVVVGHNPSVGQLIGFLDDGQGPADARSALERGFPTAAVAAFEVPTPFADLDEGGATLVDVVVPGG
jgi:phosphohistidine phosphatase